MLLNRFLIQAETGSEWSPSGSKEGDIKTLNGIWVKTKKRLYIGENPVTVERKTDTGIIRSFATNIPGLYFVEVRTFGSNLIISRKLEFFPISE